ncbi:MAG: hypothetical protein HY924_04480 [Elusimicrobia bacterium]|nr:hypothetical protein [Elusimicrobiota bacterium]
MKTLLPLVLATLALTLGAPAAQAQDQAMDQLGISMEQAKDLCSYAKDVLYGGDNRYSWEQACGAAQPDVAKLKGLKDLDSLYHYNDALYAAPARKQTVLGLRDVFKGSEFQTVQDDSDRDAARRVQRCMTKQDCLNSYKDEADLAPIEPAITPRTFPAWLPPQEAGALLPVMMIAEDERLRNEKYKQLKVPLDEKERKKHCAVPAHEGACAQFERVQKQLGINKEAMHRLKGVSDPDEFAKILGEGRQRMADAEGGSEAVLSQWGRSDGDDPSKPYKPQQKMKVSAPPPAAGQVKQAEEDLAGKAKKLTAAGTAMVISTTGLLLAWGKGKLNQRDAAKKAASETSQEDALASRNGEFVSLSAEEELPPEERSLLEEYRKGKEHEPWAEFVEKRKTYGLVSPELKSLNSRIKSGAINP